jgi:hypothetical protein
MDPARIQRAGAQSLQAIEGDEEDDEVAVEADPDPVAPGSRP